MTFFGEYQYIWVDYFCWIQIYLDPIFFRKIQICWFYQNRANMNTNTIIWTDICIYEYKCYHTQNKINIYVYEYKSYESMQMYVHMCNNTQFMVLGLKYKKNHGLIFCCWHIQIPGVRRHCIKNTSSYFKRTQRPRLVQVYSFYRKTKTLFLNVSKRYLCPQSTFSFLDSI